jgi:molybdopterin synthase catalytic subunit
MIALCAEPLVLEPLIAAVRDDAHGAIVTFLGVTRVTSNGDPRPVAALDYEAYAAMAQVEMEAIAAEARARFGPLRIAMVHRTGRVALGEPSVAIAVGTPHRPQAFAACAFAIDALKSRVEIWKNECYADGASAWRPNAETAP